MHTLIQNAKTETKIIYNSADKPTATLLTINDQFQHRFDHKSRITKFASQFGEEETNNRFNNGHFFFVNNQLADYRESDYQGFIHNNDSINQLIDTIGFQTLSRQTRHNYRTNTPVSDILLYNHHHRREMQIIPGDGGVFDTQIGFMWSPFQSYVKSVFELVRLICANGMVATDELLSAKVPLINQWEDNLNVAVKQIESRVHSKISHSLNSMVNRAVDVSTLSLLNKHASTRLLSNDITLTDEQRSNLDNIAKLTYIADNKNTTLGKFIPSHMSQYDAFNIATEISSHSPECAGSTTKALQLIANQLVFSENKYVAPPRTAKLSPFSNPDQAFFGAVQ